MKFIEDMSVEERKRYFEERRKIYEKEQKKALLQTVFDKATKYRCEQMVICKINNVPTNNAQTKREFIVSKATNGLGELFVKVKISDNIINITPQTYQEAVMVVAELDNLKCDNIIVNVNSDTGAVSKVLNHSDIIQKWRQYKKKLEESSSIVPESAKKAIEDFVNMTEKQICVETNLIEDLRSKMFFDLYFNKYLVNSSDKLHDFNRIYQSQLFNGFVFDLIIKQNEVKDSADRSTISKTGTPVLGTIDLSKLEDVYNEKYKPIIQYRFSEFDLSLSERSYYDKEGVLLESEVTIIEEVRNNVQLFIHYTLKKLDDSRSLI